MFRKFSGNPGRAWSPSIDWSLTHAAHSPPGGAAAPDTRLPFTIALATWKGGSRKTTATVNLAVAAMEAGETALILDADQTQASALLWSKLRGGAGGRWSSRSARTRSTRRWSGRRAKASPLSRSICPDTTAWRSPPSCRRPISSSFRPSRQRSTSTAAIRRGAPLPTSGIRQSVLLNRVRSPPPPAPIATATSTPKQGWCSMPRSPTASLSPTPSPPDVGLEWPGDSARAASGEIRAAYRCMRERAEARHD